MKIVIDGLGYVSLPLFVESGKQRPIITVDLSEAAEKCVF